jgi:hypothetical protein
MDTDYKVGTPVLFLPKPDREDHKFLQPSIGVIVAIDKNPNTSFPYNIIFDDNDDDWYSDEANFIAEIIQNYQDALNGLPIQIQERSIDI